MAGGGRVFCARTHPDAAMDMPVKTAATDAPINSGRLTAIYHVTESADRIAARAEGIAVEQSVEMPVSAINDRGVLENIVGRVEDIADLGNGTFAVRIGL